MRRKRSLNGNGVSNANGTSHESGAANKVPIISWNQPWPVEATVLAGISLWVALESYRHPRVYINEIEDGDGDLHYPVWLIASILTAASSLVSCCFVWWKCRMTSALSTAHIGADPDGLAIGSTLVPLLFCSVALFAKKDPMGDDRRREIVVEPFLLEPFALASSATSLTFAMSSVLLWRNKRGGIATKHTLLVPCILFIIMKVMVAANADGVHLIAETTTTMALSCVGLQAILIYLYSRPKPCSVYAAFTPGEWSCVAQLLSSAVLGFLFVDVNSDQPKLDDSDMHLAIAHGGIVGCIIGCALSNVVHVVAKKRVHSKSVIFGCATKLVIIVSVTVACVELVARRWGALDATISYRGRFIPISLWWLVLFLRTPDESMPNISFHNTPKCVFLIYWLVILSLAALPAHRMASYLRNLPESTERRKLVVVSRKYFHFVAVLLFLPPTILAPSMMSLSYAVALSILLLVENLRPTILSVDNQLRDSSVNQFYEAFLDEKDAMARSNGQLSQSKRVGGVFVVTHMAMIFGCAFPLWVNKVVQKVIGGPDHPDHTTCNIPGAGDILSLLPSMGIIVLGVGDAIGAIVGVYFGCHEWPGTKRTIEGSLGMFFSMALSTVVVSYLDPASVTRTSAVRDAALVGLYACPQLLILTLLEAFTSQIDNLCLPISASILFLVGARGQ